MSDEPNAPAVVDPAEPAPADAEPAETAGPFKSAADAVAFVARMNRLEVVFVDYLGGADRRETLRKLLSDG